MDKKTYDLLYNCTDIPATKMNEPFCFMKAKYKLNKNGFLIWNRNNKHQNIHAHDYYQIWYIFRGHCTHRIDNRKFNLEKGDIIIIPPFSYHSMSEGSEDLIVIGVDFTQDFFSSDGFDKNLVLRCITPIFLKLENEKPVFLADNNLENLIIEMFDEFVHRKPFFNTIIKSNLSKLLVILFRTDSTGNIPSNKKQSGIAEVLKYIHSNLNEKIMIEDLCRISKMSETLLSNCFKSTTGKTVVEYINSLKADKAKQLLKETDMRIIDIACELGFNDGAYFNRVFKKFVNMTPYAYRKFKQQNKISPS